MGAKVSDTGRARRLRILISAGATREPIDAVRFLSNYSTGYMGAQLAAEALRCGHRVTVVSGYAQEPMPPSARLIRADDARRMDAAMRRHAAAADVVIMAAAVSDFRPARQRRGKLPRRTRVTLDLEATPDIIARLPRSPGQVRVGFAVERGAVLPRARRKLREKRLDLLLAQRLNGHGEPFGRGRVSAWLVSRDGAPRRLGRISKPEAARRILDKAEALWYGQRRLK